MDFIVPDELCDPTRPLNRKLSFQDEATGSARFGEADPAESGNATEGRNRTGLHLPDLPQDQVCRRHRPHLQLLQRPVLRQMRREGGTQVQQGEGQK